jgi:two-component system response regulator AtoC
MENVRTGARILVVEDESGPRNIINLALKHQGYSPDFADDPEEAASRLRAGSSRYGAMLVALDSQPGARQLIGYARQLQPPVPVIGVVTATHMIDEDLRLDGVMVKPVTGEVLRKAMRNLASRSAAADAGSTAAFPASAWRAEMQPIIAQVAAADVPVLVRGETGSGKEVLARQLHALSGRARKPLLKVNCAALPSELIESELFGYERGAFTGAFKTTPGKFEMADGGTIFLDEIGDMDFKLQAKLLQVLQDCEFSRLGSSEPCKVDVRVIAATHCDLEAAIAANRFREDLYYRLNVIHISVPPLRERKDEILPLANFFIRKYATASMPALEIPPALANVLLAHDWPGNVRELENIMRRLLVVRKPDYIAQGIQTTRRRSAPFVFSNAAASPLQEITAPADYAPHAIGNMHDDAGAMRDASSSRGIAADPAAGWSVLDRVDHARREAESEAILNALNSTFWNRKRAAELLNIDYKALLYKMKKLGIAERAASAVM